MNKVKVGFFSFTEITDPKEHRAYNEWHMLDHMPEQFPLDGLAYGQRWVSTPACRAARSVSGEQLDPAHYVTLYLMTEPVDRTLREFYALGGDLRALGRFHQARQSHLAGPFRRLEEHAASRVLVSAESIPYRPHRGIHVIVEEPLTRDAAFDDYQQWWHREHAAALCALDGVAGCWRFASSPAYRDLPWSTGDRRITVLWLDGDVIETAQRIDAADADRRQRGESTTIFAGPFETITPWEWDWFDE